MTSRRPSIFSSVLKRQTSGDVPSLSIEKRPLTNSTNLTQRSILSKRKFDEINENSFHYDVEPTNYASITKANLVKRKQIGESTTSKRKIDDSLRIVTSTVQGMKHWAKKCFSFPILFEIFGQLDSQVTNISSTNSRQFSLIDENDRLECLFTEIDQKFSQVDRDVQLRIVCRFDSSNEIARCVSIRVANRDEWNERKEQIQISDLQLNDEDLQMKKMKKK